MIIQEIWVPIPAPWTNCVSQINYIPSLGPRFHQSIEEAEHPWGFFKIPLCSHLLWFHLRMFIFPNICMLHTKSLQFSSVQFSSVAQSCLTPWTATSQSLTSPWPSPTPRACSNSCPSSWTNAIQPSHPLTSPSPPTFILSQHQGLFQ